MLKHTREYLDQLNTNIDDKLNILPHIVGENVLDAGSGGGALTKILRQNHYNTYSMDLSEEVNRNLYSNNHDIWMNHIKSDVREIHKHIEYGEIDTVIFCSVLHEVYSYNGFMHSNVKDALQSAWKVLPKGGRIIIRDGIETSKWQHNIIRFHDKDDMDFVRQYSEDFRGRKIVPTYLNDHEILLPHNDAMELLYTYTWGKESYEREVQEQFGIMSVPEYINYLKVVLEGSEIVSYNHYLQEGYNHHLLKKVKFMNEEREIAKLPDSTALFVIEKTIN